MKYLSLDTRALALMRMAIASILLLDLTIRLSDLELFYSDTGVFPLSMLFQYSWNRYFISLHTISGLWQFQLLLFILSYLFAIFLFIGYRTRLFTFLSWFMLLSLHNRNGLILQGGDDLLRMVLFWCIFIPWGTNYSCDSILEKPKEKQSQVLTVATIAYILQIGYLYTGSALLKGPEWNTDFTALYYTYSLDQISYPITKYIYYYPELLKTLTFIAYYFELLVPLLFFIPVKHSWFRLLGVLGILVFHSLNAATLLIGLFPVIGIATALGLVPTFAMDAFDKSLFNFKKNIYTLFFTTSFFINHFIIRWREQRYMSTYFSKKFQTALLIFLLVFVFDWNFSNLSFVNSKLSSELRFIGYSLRLDQSWGMFAPGVFKEDGWYVLEGTLASGEVIDLLRDGKKVNYTKPSSVVTMFKNDRWRKYSENYIFEHNSFMRGYFCNYVLKKWNELHVAEKINLVRVVYMKEFTQPDYKYAIPEKNVLWEYEE